MVSARVVVKNPLGLHMRPAQRFVKGLTPFECDILVKANGRQANAKSIMSLMTAGIKQGTEVEICCEGKGEQEALATALGLIESGLGEFERKG